MGGTAGRRTAAGTGLEPAEPPSWLAIEDEPPELPPLPPDPLGPDPFAHDADSPGASPVPDEDAHSVAELLDLLPPGPELAAELESINARAVDLYNLVELIAGFHRLSAWAHARVIEFAGQLADRPGINPHHPLPGGTLARNCAAAEIAPRLGMSRYSARGIVERGRLLRNQLEQTMDALRSGLIDSTKAATLARLLAEQPADVAWEVQRLVLPGAAHQTNGQLANAVEEALIGIDPHRATQRHRRARDKRRVDHPRRLADGMAGIYSVLPATDAIGLDLALEAAARSAKASGDRRTIDQLRADALALMGHSALEQGFIGLPQQHPDPPVAEPEADGRSGGSAVHDTSTPATDPEPAPVADGASELLPAPEDRSAPSPDGSASTPPPDVDAAEDDRAGLQPVSDYLRRLHMPVGAIGGRRALISVTVPLSVLVLPPESQGGHANLGECPAHLAGAADDAPGASSADSPVPDSASTSAPEPAPVSDGPEPAEVADLEGYGPITPDVARALAMTGDTWQRLVTDPLSGVVLDVGRTRYRPPAALAEYVRSRDRSCIVPGCSAPAQRCDLDHIEPYPVGPTSAMNLGPLCTPDHVVKTVGGYQVRSLGRGCYRITTPSGHSYRRDHRGRVTWLRTASGPAFHDVPSF